MTREREIGWFTVLGTPEPQGSIRAFVRGGKVALTSTNKKLKPWRQQVGLTAKTEIAERAEKHVPVSVEIDFYFNRPQSCPKKRLSPSVKPDLDKLIRAILDALTGIAFVDDGQVVKVIAQKMYGEIEQTEIRIYEV